MVFKCYFCLQMARTVFSPDYKGAGKCGGALGSLLTQHTVSSGRQSQHVTSLDAIPLNKICNDSTCIWFYHKECQLRTVFYS